MTDLLITGMVAPATGITYVTLDGTCYRPDPLSGFVQARPEHIGDLQRQGFTVATAGQVPPGVPLQDDVGWSEDPAAAAAED